MTQSVCVCVCVQQVASLQGLKQMEFQRGAEQLWQNRGDEDQREQRQK